MGKKSLAIPHAFGGLCGDEAADEHDEQRYLKIQKRGQDGSNKVGIEKRRAKVFGILSNRCRQRIFFYALH